LTPELVQLAEAGKVRVEFRHRVLWPERSQLPAEAAECAADQGQFWAYAHLLFERQQPWTPVKLKALAKEIGLDEARFRPCLDGRIHRSAVEAETAAAEAAGVNATPTFVVNGQVLALKRSFREVIEAVTAGR
jgi:protein-disulfide isomerase